ncbi:tigger transposable element-derived protein 4-like [Leptopilina boulardi]|uniref:tigger transposable element-derived protein 4-like n=1 Tax=Leptopilina boulardi TaxID=63433 RepID=UPI0021F5A4A8|nr:tigger transposable element-derived protein 4-like [Leptopilina boulardi]
MDQGIIRALKTNFRKNLVLKTVDNLLDAILMIYVAWTKISQETISNCYKHAGFSKIDENIPSTSTDFIEEVDIPISTLVEATDFSISLTKDSFEEYVDFNNELITSEDPSDESIVQSLKMQDIIPENNHSDDDDESEMQDDEICPTPNVSAALLNANLLSTFVHSTYDDDDIKISMSRLHNAIRKSYCEVKVKEKQTKITDFF